MPASRDPTPRSTLDSAPPAHAGKSAARIPGLDALRGVAILGVLAVHFFPDVALSPRAAEWMKKLLHAGWIGVDLFFVLSGYLITGILLRGKAQPDRARTFYLRRALRILPLYLGTLIVIFGVLPWLFVPAGADPRFDAMRTHQIWYWLHSANVVALLHGFPAMGSPTVGLEHFWSLAVEEHFYLLWPFVVWRCATPALLRIVLALICTALLVRLCAVSPTLATGDLSPGMKGLFVFTPARMDALAFGALVALLEAAGGLARWRKTATFVLAISTAVLGADFFIEKGLWSLAPFVRTVGLTVIGAGWAAVLVLLLTTAPSRPAFRFFDNPALRFFGTYSYGLYVLHGFTAPLADRLGLATLGPPLLGATLLFLGKVGLAVGAALLSWWLVEAPFLRLKSRL